ncbi:MAG: hypothetical protein L0Y36_07270 [Planctomycetales bacterium]|nr:hypothetical protein [Planctomycetales bacterium]
MNETPKHEIEELLNALVEEEPNERQKTEFKRLIQHDPSLADQLASLRQQKQLLNALPVEAAPASLAEDVRAALERKMILGDYQGTTGRIVAAGHLFMRRALTVAAMLLLPLGLLAVVVFDVLKPPSEQGDYVPARKTLARDDAGQPQTPPMAPAEVFPFDGILVLKTVQPIAVSNSVEKMIFDQGLINVMLPNRTAEDTSYQITAPPEKIVALIDSLETLWPDCGEVTLSVRGGSQEQAIDIPKVQPDQITTLAQENSGELLSRLAKRYASANLEKEKMFAHTPDDPAGELTGQGYPPLNVPILTGRVEPAPITPNGPAQPSIRLRIDVKRTVD